jgi:hypothetical protein
MKAFKNTAVLTVVLILGLTACKKTDSNAESLFEAVMRETGAVHVADGVPLGGGVQVVSGDESTSAGADGVFALDRAMTVNGRTIVHFEKQGYFPLTRSSVWANDEMHLDILLQTKGNSGNSVVTSFAADRTATLSAGGMKVDIPASSPTAADGKIRLKYFHS